EGIGPCRPAACRVFRPGRGREIAAVNRRTPGGIRDHEPVAEQLCEQLHVRRLTTTSASARKFEQRFERLNLADAVAMPLTAVRLGERKEEIPVGPFACPQGFLW